MALDSTASRSRDVALKCAVALVTAFVCGCLSVAAILMPAPLAVVPLIAVCCVGMPVFASWPLAGALGLSRRADLAEFRRALDRLPEAEHPLGL